MTLYKVTNGVGDWWVIAEHPTEAEEKVKTHLNKHDYGYTDDRQVINISIIATESNNTFITDHFLLS